MTEEEYELALIRLERKLEEAIEALHVLYEILDPGSEEAVMVEETLESVSGV